MQNLTWGAGFVVLWSSGFVGATLASASSTSGVLAWRYLATAALLLTATSVVRSPRAPGREVLRQTVIGALAHVVFLGGVFGAAAAGVDTGTTALVCAAQPLLVTLAGRAVWGDRVGPVATTGLLVGLAAVALTVGGGGPMGAAGLLPVASLLGLSGATLLQRRWPPESTLLQGLTIQCVVAAGAFTLFAAATGDLAVSPTRDVVGAVLWLVALSGIGGYATFLTCLRRLGATATSTLLYLTPPVTTLWAWAMFAERPGAGQLLGLTLGAAAVGLVLVGQRPRAAPRADAVHRPQGAIQDAMIARH